MGPKNQSFGLEIKMWGNTKTHTHTHTHTYTNKHTDKHRHRDCIISPILSRRKQIRLVM